MVRMWIATALLAAMTGVSAAAPKEAGWAAVNLDAMKACQKQLSHDIETNLIFEIPFPGYQADVWVTESEWWKTRFKSKIRMVQEVACVLEKQGMANASFGIRGDVSGKILATWKDGILTPN
jgi:hypothetical protein